MPTRRSWRELAPGGLALAATVAVALAILVFARVGALHGDTIRLYLATGGAGGIVSGSDVWLEGKPVGKVHDLRFRPPSADTTHRILIAIDVLTKYRDFIRRDSPAQIRSGATLISPAVVYFGAGTPQSPPVADGDTLLARSSVDVQSAMNQFGVASSEFATIVENVSVLGTQLKSAQGTLGALGFETKTNGTPLDITRLNAGRLGARLNGRGTVGRLLNGRGALMARAQAAMAGADSVRTLLASNSTSFGRFRRDSTLARNVANVQRELATVQRLLDESRGTAGRVIHDDAVTSALDAAQREMAALFADIKAHPLRYVHL